MNNKQIVFTAPWQVEVRETPLTAVSPGPHEALVKKKYTLISPGTELACLSGNEGWFGMPGVPGYAAVSEVIETGKEVAAFQPGDLVFHYGDHSAYQIVAANGVFLKAPRTVPQTWIPFARMAMTAIRVSQIELGDSVLVAGLGLVGNMAAQLAGLQGANVIGLDLAGERLKLAEACGIGTALHAERDDISDEIRRRTSGAGVNALIEATGSPRAAIANLPHLARFGELILLGSPRGEHQANVTELLNYVHLNNYGNITFKGAHEWRYPVERNDYAKHSMVRNSQVVFELMERGKLIIEPLISMIVKPEEAAGAYEGLRVDKDRFHGVLFDCS